MRDVMTKLEDCYTLPLHTRLNFETFTEIKEQGYSRIPVYSGEKENIVHILFTKGAQLSICVVARNCIA